MRMNIDQIRELMGKVKAIVADYDRTTTNPDLTPSRKAFEAIHKAKEKMNMFFILASGRPLNFFMKYREIVDVCDAIVAENGAIVFLPKSNEKKVFGCEAASVVKELIKRLNIPAEFFEVIVSISRDYDEVVTEALKNVNLPITVEYNVDSIMVMPMGISKLNGVLEALKVLGEAEGNFMAFGDGENDVIIMRRALIAVAVANALPQVKEVAHYVTSKPYGDGVAEFLESIIR